MRKLLKVFLLIVLFLFIILNFIAAFNAYHLTHFYRAGETEEVPFSKLGIGGKVKFILLGQKFVKSDLQPPPDIPHENISVNTEDGYTLAGWYFKHPVDSVKGTICAFHGQKASRGGLQNQIEEFYNSGYDVLTVDFRGHGESEGYETSYGVREIYDVKAAFDFAKSTGEDNIILYGQSMGGATVMRAAGKLKIEPNRIIADAGFGSLVDAVEGRCRMVRVPPEPFGVLITFWMGALNGYWAFDHANWKYGGNIESPVLIQRGTEDERVSKEETLKVYNSIGSNNKKMVEYEGLGHENYLEAQPEVWKKNVLDFLNN